MQKRIKFWLAAALIIAAAILIIIKLAMPAGGTNTPDKISSEDWTWGNKDSKIVLIEYSDFACPACRSAWSMMEEIETEFKDDIIFTFRHFPLPSLHKNAKAAAWAAEAAGIQGKFWEMYDILFKYRDDWKDEADPQLKFEKYAEGLGLNIEKFKDDYLSDEVREKIDKSYENAHELGLRGTPTFFLNGKEISSWGKIKSLIREMVDGQQ